MPIIHVYFGMVRSYWFYHVWRLNVFVFLNEEVWKTALLINNGLGMSRSTAAVFPCFGPISTPREWEFDVALWPIASGALASDLLRPVPKGRFFRTWSTGLDCESWVGKQAQGPQWSASWNFWGRLQRLGGQESAHCAPDVVPIDFSYEHTPHSMI